MHTETLSILDIFKIGVGPSSSHTLGPWRAALQFIKSLEEKNELHRVLRVSVLLYGSLAKTGKGHATDIAVMLGLSGKNPVTVETAAIEKMIARISAEKKIFLKGKYDLRFDPKTDIVFLTGETLPAHPNALTFLVELEGDEQVAETFYSTGGGFISQDLQKAAPGNQAQLPYDLSTAASILHHCDKTGHSISELAFENEKRLHKIPFFNVAIHNIWLAMRDSIYRGCITEGELPGGLRVKRRAASIAGSLLHNNNIDFENEWFAAVKHSAQGFTNVLDWVSCFALAVTEENASMGRIVTAPTNGAAGVIPAVLMYYKMTSRDERDSDTTRFLLTAGTIGIACKNGATISAAMGGCQAEIGVSSAMAAAGLTEVLGGSPRQVLMASEIAMEHHLGLTCDPVGGLVQVPCIERNAMGAIKAITAAQLALKSDPAAAKVSLDQVIRTMWETAQDMHSRYKETSEGGLAQQVPVGLADC